MLHNDWTVGKSGHVTEHNEIGSRLRNVMDYGAVGDGVADDTAAIQAAINTGVILGYGQSCAGRVILQLNPGKVYKITQPINLCNMWGITIDGGSSQMGAVIDAQCTGMAAFEIIGSRHIEIRNLEVYGHVTNTPTMAFWVSRSTTADSSMIIFHNVLTYGYFTKCIYYGLETEDNHFYDCTLNTYGGGLEAVAYIARANDLALTPHHTTLMGAGYGSHNINFHNSHLIMDGAAATARAIYVRDTAGVVLRDCYLTSWEISPIELEGNAEIILDTVSIEGNYGTTVKLTARVPGDVVRIRAINFSFSSPTNYSLYADNGVYLRDSYFINTAPGISGGLFKPFRLYSALGCDFSGLFRYSAGAFDITVDGAGTGGFVGQCRFHLGLDDTITLTGDAYEYGNIRDEDVAFPGNFHLSGGKTLQIAGAWNNGPLILGDYYLWVDATGDLRIKSGAPANDTDGTVVGTQS